MIRKLLAAVAALVAMTGIASAQSATPSVQITPTTTAYTAGECLGNAGASAILSFSGIVPSGTGGAVLSSITVADSSGQDAPIDFLVFRKKPTGTYTDHAACSIATADLPYALGPFSVSGYKTYGTPGVATVNGIATIINNIANGYPAGASFWVVPVVQGTPTYGTATLDFTFGLAADGPSQ